MAYMVYQRYTTAIREAYGAADVPLDDLQEQLASARGARRWLESLIIDPSIRASMAEPIAVIEEAFHGLLLARVGSVRNATD